MRSIICILKKDKNGIELCDRALIEEEIAVTLSSYNDNRKGN